MVDDMIQVLKQAQHVSWPCWYSLVARLVRCVPRLACYICYVCFVPFVLLFSFLVTCLFKALHAIPLSKVQMSIIMFVSLSVCLFVSSLVC